MQNEHHRITNIFFADQQNFLSFLKKVTTKLCDSDMGGRDREKERRKLETAETTCLSDERERQEEIRNCGDNMFV